MTKNAKYILDLVNQAHDHYTAEDIFFKLKENGVHISLATVYNNLKTLTDNKAIHRVSLEGYPDRYDRIERHDHLVCKTCGKLTDICLDDLTQAITDQVDVPILGYDLKIGYVCPECRARLETESAVS